MFHYFMMFHDIFDVAATPAGGTRTETRFDGSCKSLQGHAVFLFDDWRI